MQTVRLPLLRGALFIIALAAVSILLARGDNPAAATTFNPQSSVSVSDPTPGAAADLIIDFSLNAPDSYPNLTNKPAIQFLPRQWGIHVPETEEEELARVGGIAGTFITLTKIGLIGQCNVLTPVSFTMFDSTPDTAYDPATGAYDPEKLTSSLDFDGNPMSVGYSGQFRDDPNTADLPSDWGLPLIGFNADEKYTGWSFGSTSNLYRDADGNSLVSAGDIRLQVSPAFAGANPTLGPGTYVQAGDPDEAVPSWLKRLNPFRSWDQYSKHDEHVAANGQMDPGEHVYRDWGRSGDVSEGDERLFEFEDQGFGSVVKSFALPGGVTRYPDFLNSVFPPEALGNPLVRQFGQSQVDFVPVSLNLVTFSPGQLPGYPASLGYPTVVVVLDPLALGRDPVMLSMNPDLCTPLVLTSTNLGISQDNPETPSVDEGGFIRLSNPKAEKDHIFTLVVESQADADDDGQENILDMCPRDPNINDLDGRALGLSLAFPNPTNPDGDSLDAACDTLEFPPADWDTPLVTFNQDEKHTGYAFGNPGSHIYRDNDASGNVSAGDDRLHHGTLPPGLVQATDPDAMGTPSQRRLYSFAPDYWGSVEKHAENVSANGKYDPGENVYRDNDFSGHAGFTTEDAQADERLLFEGSLLRGLGSARVQYIGTHGLDPARFLWTGDVDQDSYNDVADNCALVANGVELLDVKQIGLRSVTFFATTRGDLIGPDEQADTDGDGIGDACEGAEHGAQCLNDIDDDGDGVVNDGCPIDPHPGDPVFLTWGFGESVMSGGDFGWCEDDIDNDGDGVVNDGCPGYPHYYNDGEPGPNCGNGVDDDGDGRIDDGCPTVRNTNGAPETGDQCNNNLDDDGDGLVNDGCPAVDPGDVAKTTVTGHVHMASIERTVTIARHGVKLDDLDGKESVSLDGSANYKVSVENKSGSAEDFPVAVRVIGGCGTVSGPPTVHVNADATANAQFTVDFSGCAAGSYTVQADACHGDDPAPDGGLFGVGPCGGVPDGMVDTNPLDDAPRSITVVVGSP